MLRILILILFIPGCSKKAQSVAGQHTKMIEMSKSPCFGFCPVYQLVIYQDGMMRIMAKQNMKISGSYTKQLTPAQLNSIKSGLDQLKLDQYQDEYREPVADAPSTELIFYKDQAGKKIFTNFLFPEPLQKIADELNQHAVSEHWTKWTDPRVRQEFIILLEDNVSLSTVLSGYSDYELELVKRLDPGTSKYYLIRGLVLPGEEGLLLKKLKKDPSVREAQLNASLDLNR